MYDLTSYKINKYETSYTVMLDSVKAYFIINESEQKTKVSFYHISDIYCLKPIILKVQSKDTNNTQDTTFLELKNNLDILYPQVCELLSQVAKTI